MGRACGDVYRKAYGKRALVPSEEPMTEDTIFDAASLTKVVATTPAIMLLVERGKVELDEPVQQYIPEFCGGRQGDITVRHLLTHTSGLRPGIPGSPRGPGTKHAIDLAARRNRQTPPGTVFRYSDINFILLGEIVQRVSGQEAGRICRAAKFIAPLKMSDTGYLPPAEQARAHRAHRTNDERHVARRRA